jgi:hypothetical protein
VARSKAQARMGWWIDLFMVCGRVARYTRAGQSLSIGVFP